MKNQFFSEIAAMEERCASNEELTQHLGKGRAKRGMHDGLVDEGELEIGQIAGLVKDIPTVDALVRRLVEEYNIAVNKLPRTMIGNH